MRQVKGEPRPVTCSMYTVASVPSAAMCEKEVLPFSQLKLGCYLFNGEQHQPYKLIC